MIDDSRAQCYRLLPTGRLERIAAYELNIPFGTGVQPVCERLGYEVAATMKLGNTRASQEFRVEVHERHVEPDDPRDSVTADYRFLVALPLSTFYEYFFVEDLPDLVPFLAQLAPIAHASFIAYQEDLRELRGRRSVGASVPNERGVRRERIDNLFTMRG